MQHKLLTYKYSMINIIITIKQVYSTLIEMFNLQNYYIRNVNLQLMLTKLLSSCD